MDLMEVIRKRSSVRKYGERLVRREDIDECLEAARLAPSACNSQPWEFIVVDAEPVRGRLCDAMLGGIYGMNSFIRQAPVLVAVVTDCGSWFPKVCNTLRDTKMYLVDLGIACEHFALRAAELGIGTCYLGWFNEKAAKKALGIGRGKRIQIALAVGYPSPDWEVREKTRKSLAEMSEYR